MLCAGPTFFESAGGVVPCGQCLPCKVRKRRERVARLLLEAKCHEHILFVTFTYNDDNLPRDIHCPRTGELIASHPGGCVDYRTVQLMLKRLRRRLPPQSLRYYGVAEYGPQTMRPHYHFIFFGLSWRRRFDLYDVWADPHTQIPYCDADRLDIQQPHSETEVAQYVSGYLIKKMTKADDDRLQGRPPEKAFMSKGIASPYLDRLLFGFTNRSALAKIRNTGELPREFKFNGKKWPLDRYLREKILERLPPDVQAQVKETRVSLFAQEMQDLQKRAEENPQVPEAWLIGDEKHRRWALEKQFILERDQDLTNFNRKIALYEKRTAKC